MDSQAPISEPQPARTPEQLRAPLSRTSRRPLATARPWLFTALISATFTLVVAAMMLVNYKRSIAEDPLDARDLVALREKLHANPKDEPLKKQIREADLRERQRYFTRVRRNTSGAFLLAIGGAVFVLSVARYVTARSRTPLPRPITPPAEVDRQASRARIAVIGTSIVIVGGLAAVGMLKPVSIHPVSQTADKKDGAAVTPIAPVISAETLRANWPRFRGADGLGICAYTNIPMKWNVESSENVAWKSPVPMPGHNSPVIWGSKLFLTGSTDKSREILCFDSGNGALLWRLPVTLVTPEAVEAMEIPKLSGSTAATVACDDQRVFAIFATGELIAANHDGHQIWSKNFGKLENGYGHASSLLVWRDRLIVQLDQGSEEEGKSRVYAFDVATGSVVWEQKRKLPSSWGTPIIAKAGNTEQIICLGEPWLIGYNALDGKELWRFKGLGSDLTPSPIFAAGLVIAISPNQKILGIRPDGQGDITATHVAWTVEQNVPDIASPVSNGELLFAMETSGNLVCLDVKTGKKIWEHAYDGEFQSSPAIAGNHLYVTSTEGSSFVLEVGREFKELAQNKFNEPIRATPAFTDGKMFVRGETNLFCITVK